MGALIARMILPTVSSLVFLPTASVAAKRGFHMEAMVYFFTMFFTASVVSCRKGIWEEAPKDACGFPSRHINYINMLLVTMVYFFTMFFTVIFHACEGPGLSILCFMRYDLLEYFSIYATALSMWVTLTALGDFDEPQRSSISMFGVLTIAVRTYQDRWGYGVYSGPIGSAVFIITVKWLHQMKQLRALYPEKKVYTQQVGPGCCFGALALMLRFYFEEWDYSYVHSFYHLSLAVSFILLLPKKNRHAGTGSNAAKLSCFALCCCSLSPGYSKDKSSRKQNRSVWNRSGTPPTLPLYSSPPSTPVKGTNISKLKEMNGWK